MPGRGEGAPQRGLARQASAARGARGSRVGRGPAACAVGVHLRRPGRRRHPKEGRGVHPSCARARRNSPPGLGHALATRPASAEGGAVPPHAANRLPAAPSSCRQARSERAGVGHAGAGSRAAEEMRAMTFRRHPEKKKTNRSPVVDLPGSARAVDESHLAGVCVARPRVVPRVENAGPTHSAARMQLLVICQDFLVALHLLGRESSLRDHAQHSPPFSCQSPRIFILSTHSVVVACQACLPRALLARRHRTPHALWAPPRWLGGAPRRLARAGVRAHASAVIGGTSLHHVSGRRCVGKPPGSAGRLLGSRARAAGGRRRRARWSRRASAIERATPRRRSARLRGCAAALRGCAEARRLGVARLAALCTAARRAGCPCGPYFCTLCISSLPRPPPRASPPRAGR